MMGDDEWDALEHYLRAGAVPAVELERDEALEQLAAVIPTTGLEEATG